MMNDSYLPTIMNKEVCLKDISSTGSKFTDALQGRVRRARSKLSKPPLSQQFSQITSRKYQPPSIVGKMQDILKQKNHSSGKKTN